MSNGENLVFIISLPRSGSTMLQHILGAHSKMIASAEPWILFPASLALQKGMIKSVYDHEICAIALTDFLNQLEGKEQVYYEAVNMMASHLYQSFLKGKKENIYIDKTSRYYLILPQLIRIFPQAKFIFLIRNPLANFSSFLTTMVNNDITRLGNEEGIRNDLLNGYKLINEGIKLYNKNCIVVNYEDIIDNPKKEIKKITEYIGVEFEEEMLYYKRNTGVLKGKLVDPKSIHKHDTPVNDYKEEWKNKLDTTQKQLLAKSFIEHLGKDLIESIGYSYIELISFFKDKKLINNRFKNISWNDLMAPYKTRTELQKNRSYLINRKNNADYISIMKFLMKHPIRFIRVLITSNS